MTGSETPVPAATGVPQGRGNLVEHLAVALLITPIARVERLARWAARRAYLPTSTAVQVDDFLTMTRRAASLAGLVFIALYEAAKGPRS